MHFGSLIPTFAMVVGLTGLGASCSNSTETDPTGASTGASTSSTSGMGGTGGIGGGSTDVGGGVGGAPSPCPTIAPALSSIASNAFPDDQPGGVIVGVASPSCPGWVNGAGGLDPIPADGLVKYASGSRLLVAATIMSLVDDGDLALSDTLDGWRPELPNAASITVRMLLNQTSGLSNHFTNPTLQSALTANPKREFLPAELIDYTAELSAEPPGTFASQFINYIILGVIIEEVTAKPAHMAIRERVLDPLGLTSMGLLGPEIDENKLVAGYGPNGQDATSVLHPSAWWVSASYAGTVSDMVHLLRGVLGTDTVLSAASRAAMIDMPVATGEPQYEVGLGLYVDSSPPHDLIGQAGSIPGYEIRAFYVPELDASITIVATNDGAATLIPLYDTYKVLAQPQ